MHALRLVLAFLLLITNASATTVEVGASTIDIPAPRGFVQVTPRMKELWQLVQAGQGDNHILAFFIPEHQEKSALEGRSVDLDRTINIQTRRRFESMTITSETFEKVKVQVLAMVASKQIDTIQAIELERFSSSIDKATSVNPMLKQLENASLPPHVNRPDRFGYSEISTLQSSKPDGSLSRTRVTTTALAILVKGKMLNCYVAGGETDLDWTRRTANQWADTLQSTNRN
jgi:hypothetical protein